MNRQTYKSHSGFNSFNRCNRQAMYSRKKKTYPPLSEGAAGMKGKVVHAVIAAIHANPDFNIPAEVALEFDAQEAFLNWPVDYGVKGRDGHLADAISMVEWYWHWNKDIDLRSSERWFYIPIEMPGGTTEWLRGRFDQIVAGPGGELLIRELKSGQVKKNQKEILTMDRQCIIQAYALRHGYIVIGDEPYVAIDDDAYHIHEWELSMMASEPGKTDLYECRKPGCTLLAEKFGTYPAKVIWYHIPSCRPPAVCTKWRKLTKKSKPPADAEYKTEDDIKYWKEPLRMRGNPEFPIDPPNEAQEAYLLRQIQIDIMKMNLCEDSGIWEQTRDANICTGNWKCRYINHCEDLKCCNVEHEGVIEENGESDISKDD